MCPFCIIIMPIFVADNKIILYVFSPEYYNRKNRYQQLS